MDLIVVYGLQAGSEGKGTTVALVTEALGEEEHLIAVRVGAPNAGHTAADVNGEKVVTQTIPMSAFIRDCTAVIGAAGFVDPEILNRELLHLQQVWRKKGKESPMVLIDPNVTVITDQHRETEAFLKEQIGSTGKGCGAALADKIMRTAPRFSHVYPDLRKHYGIKGGHWECVRCMDTVGFLQNQAGLNNVTVLCEGTQGVQLSLFTSGYYPMVTSREVGPEAILSQCGLTTRHAERVSLIAVARTYPIRVGGNSGPMKEEISWEELSKEAGATIEPEITTVTKKIRRIARFDHEWACRAVAMTRPTELALTFLDYVFPDLKRKGEDGLFAPEVVSYLQHLEFILQIPVTIVGFGPTQAQYRFLSRPAIEEVP